MRRRRKFLEDRPKFIVQENLNKAYSIFPYKITNLFRKDSWEGKQVCIFGGGESLAKVKPEINSNSKIIGINRVAENFDVDVWFLMDVTYYLKLKQGVLDKYEKGILDKWVKFNGARVLVSPLNPYPISHDVYGVYRRVDRKISEDISRGIYPGSNSGFAAIMFAIALGSRDIRLYGYDMKVEKRTHSHSGYPGQKVKFFKQKLVEYKKEMEEFAPLFKKMGASIINCTPDSALECFPKEEK